jgi:hypothetical protein
MNMDAVLTCLKRSARNDDSITMIVVRVHHNQPRVQVADMNKKKNCQRVVHNTNFKKKEAGPVGAQACTHIAISVALHIDPAGHGNGACGSSRTFEGMNS